MALHIAENAEALQKKIVLETALQSLGAPPVVVVDPFFILALLTCTLLFQVYTSVSSSVSIFPGGARSVSIFFILYRSKLQPENEFQVAGVSERTSSRAATAIVIRNDGNVRARNLYSVSDCDLGEKHRRCEKTLTCLIPECHFFFRMFSFIPLFLNQE